MLSESEILEQIKTHVAAGRKRNRLTRELAQHRVTHEYADQMLERAQEELAEFKNSARGQELIKTAHMLLVVEQGKNKIVNAIKQAGTSTQQAYQVYYLAKRSLDDFWDTPEARPYRPEMAKRSFRRMLRGFVICLIGLVLTLGTLILAVLDGGGTYIAFVGAIAFGGYDFVRGFSGWRKHRGIQT